jgi:hypothetical protein
MRLLTAVHVLAGALGLLSGYVALYAAKGGTTHRRSGVLFVRAMLLMALLGGVLAVALDRAPKTNVPAALLTAYLVITSLTTVRPARAGARWLLLGAMLVALTTGTIMLALGVQAVAGGGRNGVLAFPSFMFGAICVLGTVGDLRVMRDGPRTGAARLARHLWRMCTALFIAALSAAVQVVRRLPASLRSPWWIALPTLVVLATMLYWLWRVRGRRALRGTIGVAAPGAA